MTSHDELQENDTKNSIFCVIKMFIFENKKRLKKMTRDPHLLKDSYSHTYT